MSRRDPEIALKQILAHAREAVELCQGRERADLDSDRLLNLALTRLIEIIGEAANRVPDSIQSKHPDLPWLQMIAARNRLIHGYDSVDFDILWTIVHDDLLALIPRLESILDEKDGSH
ncbi:MAG: DUF86 domain-containing protein [Anaerolineaceae bacterium]